MALRFLDSFDHYSGQSNLGKWTNGYGGYTPNVNSVRFGTHGLWMWEQRFVDKTLDNQSTWIIGCAIRVRDTQGTSSDTILAVIDSGTTQVDLHLTGSSGLLTARRGGSTTLGSGSIPSWAFNVWHYIEMRVVINNTVGELEVRVDNETIIGPLTSQNTRQSANAYANTVRIGSGNNKNYDADDFYACDGTGGVNDDFWGDTRIQAIFPNANGTTSNLVGSDANSTDNYLLVDETTPATADYVESSTPGDKDTYNYGSVTPTTGTVYGVQIAPYAAKTDAGVRSIQAIARHSGTEEDTGTDMTLSTTAQYFLDTRDTKPGGGAWSISDINAAEFGVKVTA